VLEFGIGAPPEPGYAASVVVVALVAAPWLIAAARLLWRGWWAGAVASAVSRPDQPDWCHENSPRPPRSHCTVCLRRFLLSS
jgi:hypothetical protein